MTPFATTRRLRRHGKVVTALTATAALAGVAAASMAFTVGQDGTATAAPSPNSTPVVDGPTPPLPVPDLFDLGDVTAEVADLLHEATAPDAALDPARGVLPAILEPVPTTQPLPSQPDDPTIGPSEPAPVLAVEREPDTLREVIPPPVRQVLPPQIAAPVEALVEEVTQPLTPIIDPLVDPLSDALGEAACSGAEILEPVLEPVYVIVTATEVCALPADDLDGSPIRLQGSAALDTPAGEPAPLHEVATLTMRAAIPLTR